MRIKGLELFNLASLRSKHKIDFEKILHDSEGLFAITGPTGSGKSTIINAIGLCLYGKTYRNALSQGDYISLGEEEGGASLEFEFKGMVYKASWSCKIRRKNGDLLKRPSISRQLECEGQYLDFLPEDLLPLNFDQFCKTIVLHQGQFSEFLMSSFSERKDILSKLLQNEEIDSLMLHLKENLKIYREFQLKYEQKASEELPYNKTNIKEQLKYCAHEKEANESKLSKLDILKEIGQGLREFQVRNAELASLREGQEKLQEKIKELEVKRDELFKIIDQTKNLLTDYKEQDFNEISQLDLLIQKCKEKEILNITLQEKIKERNLKSDRLKEVLLGLTQVEEELKQTSSQIKLSEDEDRTEIFTAYLEDLLKYQTVSENRKKVKKELDMTQNQYSLYQDINFEEKLKKVNDQISKQQNNKILLQDISNLELQEKSEKTKFAESKKQLDKQQLKLKELAETIRKSHLFDAINTCIEQSNLDEECVVCHTKTSKKLEPIILENSSSLLVKDLEAVIEDLNLKLNQLEAKILMISQTIQTKKDSLVPLGEVELSTLQEELAQIQEKHLQYKKAKLTKAQLDLEYKSLVDKNDLLKENIANDFVLLRPYFSDQSETIFDREPVRIKFNEYKKALKFRNATQKKVQLIRHSEGLQEDLKKLEQNITTTKKDLESLNSLLKGREESQLKHAKFELELKGQKLEKGLEGHNQEKIELQTQLQNNLGQLKSHDSAKKTLDIVLQKSLLKTQEDLNKIDIIHEERDFEKIRDKIKTFTTSSEPNMNSFKNFIDQEYLSFYKECKEKLDSDISENHKREALLNYSSQKLKDIDLAKKVLNHINGKMKSLESINSLMARDEFKNFCLSQVETLLIEYTNQELKSLCDGRYEISLQKVRGNNEYFIFDHYKAGMSRKISTLSGGETFLVSLAMSLGLADFSGGTKLFDFFFIDEGFGTLDENSLEEAYEVLEQIKCRGKQLGIISHVSALTSRINVNLNLIKSGQGNSKIQTLYS